MKRVTIRAAVLCAAVWVAGCGQAAAGCGVASTYTAEKEAQGAAQNHADITAAHESLPLGTRLVVRNQKTGKSIIVEIAERAPLVGAIIDLTSNAMHALGLEPRNPVCLEVVSYGSERRGYQKLTMRDVFARASKPVAVIHKPIAVVQKYAVKTVNHRPAAQSRHAKLRSASTKHYAKLHRRTQ